MIGLYSLSPHPTCRLLNPQLFLKSDDHIMEDYTALDLVHRDLHLFMCSQY
jgi:hypothetical protein